MNMDLYLFEYPPEEEFRSYSDIMYELGLWMEDTQRALDKYRTLPQPRTQCGVFTKALMAVNLVYDVEEKCGEVVRLRAVSQEWREKYMCLNEMLAIDRKTLATFYELEEAVQGILKKEEIPEDTEKAMAHYVSGINESMANMEVHMETGIDNEDPMLDLHYNLSVSGVKCRVLFNLDTTTLQIADLKIDVEDDTAAQVAQGLCHKDSTRDHAIQEATRAHFRETCVPVHVDQVQFHVARDTKLTETCRENVSDGQLGGLYHTKDNNDKVCNQNSPAGDLELQPNHAGLKTPADGNEKKPGKVRKFLQRMRKGFRGAFTSCWGLTKPVPTESVSPRETNVGQVT